MALEKALTQLSDQLESLRASLEALSYPFLVDKSRSEDVALSGYSGDAVTDVMDWLREAIPAASRAREAAKHPLDLGGVRSALVTCQEKLSELAKRFRDKLMSFENIEALSVLKRRDDQWRKWAETVATGLQETQELLGQVSETMLLCWQELAERAGMANISVKATNIGQKIVTKAAEAEDRVGEGVT